MLSKANCNHKHWVRFVAVYLALFVWTVLGQISIHSVFIYTVIHMRAFADWSINQYFFSCYGDIFRCEIISVRIVKVIFLCRSSTIRQLLYIIKRANTLLEINPKLAHRFVESIRVLMNEKSIFMSDFGKICASRAETEEIQNFGKAKKKMHNVVWCCRRRYQTTLIGQMVPLLAGKQSWVALATGRWKPTTNGVKQELKSMHICAGHWAKRTIWLLQCWNYRWIVWLSELSKNFLSKSIFQKIKTEFITNWYIYVFDCFKIAISRNSRLYFLF